MALKTKTIKRFENEPIAHANNRWTFDGYLVEMSDGKRQLRVTNMYGAVTGSTDALRAFIAEQLGGENIELKTKK